MWRCLTNDKELFNDEKSSVMIHVGVRARMGVELQGGEILYRSKTIKLVEGEDTSIRCFANGGYPPPSFHWQTPVLNNRSSAARIYKVYTELIVY